MRLRTLLALLLTVLLAFTAGTIGWLGYSNSRLEIKRSTQTEFALLNAFASHHVIDFLDDPANRLLSELTVRARRSMLKLSDDQALGLDLAERLRINPTLAWISYSDAATGHFVGVWRNANSDIVLNVTSPGQGPAREVVVRPDGTTVPYARAQPKDYDPRTSDWFRNAMASDKTVWSAPYAFADGAKGITASHSWRSSAAATPSGVFTVDFYLKDLQDLLDGLTVDSQSFSAVLEPDGALISSSNSPDAPALVAALAAWIKAHPQFKSIQDTSHLLHLEVGPTTYLAALVHIDAPSGLKCIVAGMVPKDVIFRHVNHAATQMFEVAMSALVVAVVAGAFMAYRISQPLHSLGDDLANVGRFQLSHAHTPRSVVHEVNQLHDAADRMKSGLRSFIKYVPGDLVRQLLASGREAALGGETRRLTVFFSDIESFTSYSESVPPDELVHELAGYLDILTREVRQHSGTIDKFIGDGLLAFFNAPENVPGHEALACRATLAALHDIASWRKTEAGAPFHTRVGLHAGDVLVGNIGTAERFAYTVLGDAVNVTSRLENLNKAYGTQVLASGDVRDPAGTEFEWRHIDRASVAGRKGCMEIYELMGLKNAVDGDRLRRRDLYEKALELYFVRSFPEARALFAAISKDCPADKAAALMMTRCDDFGSCPPPSDWDGVFVHAIK
jgi:adenylate cyclase